MIDARAYLRGFSPQSLGATPVLTWRHEWERTDGAGAVVGLVDAGLEAAVPDLASADISVSWFVAPVSGRATWLSEHGAHAASLLVGQGIASIRGIVPAARLLVACVVDAEGVARPDIVAQAIDWLVSMGTHVVVVPLGGTREHDGLGMAVEQATQAGVAVLAAAGNCHPGLVMFPARHPGCIAVGAATSSGRLLMECAREPRLDLVAPGTDLAASVRGREVRRRRGSSVACVIAGGAAAAAASALPRQHPRTREAWLRALSWEALSRTVPPTSAVPR